VKLTNFELATDVELSGLGHWWDLHNFTNFVGLELLPESGSARLSWVTIRVPPYDDAGFHRDNPARSCAIRFDGVSAIVVRRVLDGTAPSDARTLHQVRMVLPLESTANDLTALGIRVPSTDEAAHLLFEFMDGFDVEIAAVEATLEADIGPQVQNDT